MIYKAVLPVMNEVDAATYSRVHRATNHIKPENHLEPKATDSLINPYKDTRFMFYCKNLRQNKGIVIFSSEKLFELTHEKAILKGDIVFNNQQTNGSIIIYLESSFAIYYHNSSKKKYPLEIDNRFASKWNALIGELQKASKLI